MTALRLPRTWISSAMVLALAASLVLLSSVSSSAPDQTAVAASATLTSWNPNVSCSPSLVTVADILGSAYPAQALAGSQYQVNSTDGGIPDKRALAPPCTITNIHNQVVSTFVQVNGVYLYTYTFDSGDCSKGFKAVNGGGRYPNNQTFCNNVTIANEVSTGSISLDLQGFVYWDENHWELHPLAAWRLTPPPPPGDFSIGASPSSLTVTVSGSVVSTITLTSLNGLSGAGSLSASISSSDLVLVWPTVAVSPSSVTLAADGTATSTLTVSTSLLTTPGTYTVTVTATIGSITHSVNLTVVVKLL